MIDESDTFSLVNADELKYMENDVGIDTLRLVTHNPILTADDNHPTTHGDSLLNILNPESSPSSGMEDYKFIDENDIFLCAFPPSDPTDLCSTDYAGPHGFEVIVGSNDRKKPWEYSSKCNKFYIDMKFKFPLNFSVQNRTNENLFVRVLPMYEGDHYHQDIVHRCICHEMATDATNQVPSHVIQHVIRCDNSGTVYFGNRHLSQRLNFVFPLSMPQAGTDSIREFFYFVCQNSCSGEGAMNRRPIHVIFTLENVHGTVLGRRILRVRVCACPKRDREKDEAKCQTSSDPKGKKRKVDKKASADPLDTKLHQVKLMIPGTHTYKKVLESVLNVVGAEIVRCQKSNTSDAHVRKTFDTLEAMLNKVS